MRWIKVLASLLLIAGIAMIGGSLYITKQINEGQIKIQEAEETLKKSDQLFSLIPQTEGIGKQISGSANKKIDAGKELIAHYQALALNLKIAGIISAVLGVSLFFVRKKNHS